MLVYSSLCLACASAGFDRGGISTGKRKANGHRSGRKIFIYCAIVLGYGRICGMGDIRDKKTWQKFLAGVSTMLVLVAFLVLYAWVSIATDNGDTNHGRLYGLFGIEFQP